jgi:hypothetical protein
MADRNVLPRSAGSGGCGQAVGPDGSGRATAQQGPQHRGALGPLIRSLSTRRSSEAQHAARASPRARLSAQRPSSQQVLVSWSKHSTTADWSSVGRTRAPSPISGKPTDPAITVVYEGTTDALADDAGRTPSTRRELSLYHRLGGKAAIEAFYVKILADVRIKHHFDDIDMNKQAGE